MKKQIGLTVATFTMFLLTLTAYFIKQLSKFIWKFKQPLYKIAIFILVTNSLLGVLTNVVYAPKPTYAEYVKPTTEHEKIVNEIIRVFGPDSPKAFQLLTDPKCHENQYLNPNAVNDNTTWGGVGRDIGVFQISTVYQRVQEKFLYNYIINIQIAHDLYVENGNHFNLWTCGKVLGI